MNRTEYEKYMNAIASGKYKDAPYDDPLYFDYTQLNTARYHRWIKKGELNTDLISIVKQTTFTNWIIITEPWCGDASHIVPFIALLSEVNQSITVNFELRDAAPYRIDQYLTNGTSKSIPIVIFSDGVNERVWGPRPQSLTKCFDELKLEKELTFDEIKIELQKWYNKDKGATLQGELIDLLK